MYPIAAGLIRQAGVLFALGLVVLACGCSLLIEPATFGDPDASVGRDAGVDAAGPIDAGDDAALPDAARSDAGFVDGGVDAGPVDAGPDVTPPTVLEFTPVSAAVGVEPDIVVSAVFSEDIDPTTIDASSFRLEGSAAILAGAVTYDASTRTASLSLSRRFPILADITAVLTTSIADTAGNSLATEQRWTFTTRDGQWSTPEALGVGWTFTRGVAVDGSGNGLAVWPQLSDGRIDLWSSYYSPGRGWTAPALVEWDDTGDIDQPQVVMDRSGYGIVVWAQSDGTRSNIWANRYTPGAGWTAPFALESMDGDAGSPFAGSPSVAVDSAGNAFAVWGQVGASGFRSAWGNRYSPATGWSGAELVELESGHMSALAVEVDGFGNAIALLARPVGLASHLWASRYSASSSMWSGAEMIAPLGIGRVWAREISLEPTGASSVVWHDSDGLRNNIWSNSYDSSTGWGTPTLVELDDAGTAFFPDQASNSDGDMVTAWSQSDGVRLNIWGSLGTSGSGWSPPVLLEIDNAGDAIAVQVAVDEAGNVLVVWRQYDGSRYTVVANRYLAAGGWQGATTIATAVESNARPSIGMTAAGSAFVTWAQRAGAVEVWSARFE